MNGKRYLFDTNAVIELLKGNQTIKTLSAQAEWIGISIISLIEFLAFPGLTDEDSQLFRVFIERIEVIGLGLQDRELIEKSIEYRKKYSVKLPDAIIAATSLVQDSLLVTADSKFKTIQEIQLFDYIQ